MDSNTSGHENLATLGGIAFGGEDATTKKPRTTSRQNRPPVTTDQAPPATTPHESPQSPTSKPAPTATISYHNEPPVTTKVTSSATTLQKSLQTASSAQQSTASPSVSAGLDTGDDAENACSVSPKLMVRRLAIGQDRRRLARRNGTLKPRAKEPNTSNCFTFTFRGQTPPPTNDGDIPASQDCTDSKPALYNGISMISPASR